MIKRIGSVSSGDIALEFFGIALGLFDLALNDITDRDDSLHLSVCHYWQMPELIGAHQPHDPLNRVFLGASNDLSRHAIGDRQRQGSSPLPSDLPNDIAFGDNTGDTLIGVYDYDGADTLFG